MQLVNNVEHFSSATSWG